MPINPRFNYSGQPWAWPLSLVILGAGTAVYMLDATHSWFCHVAILVTNLAALPIIYRQTHMANTFRKMVEDDMASKIGLALVESNLDMLKLPRRMPSDILQEALDGIQKEE